MKILLFLAGLTAFAASASERLLADDRQIQRIEIQVGDDLPPNTTVEDLADRFPEYRNFRLSRSASRAFELTKDGLLKTAVAGDLISARRSVCQLRILAECDAPPQDPLFAEFAESILQEGVTPDEIRDLQTHDRLILLRINILKRRTPDADIAKTTDAPSEKGAAVAPEPSQRANNSALPPRESSTVPPNETVPPSQASVVPETLNTRMQEPSGTPVPPETPLSSTNTAPTAPTATPDPSEMLTPVETTAPSELAAQSESPAPADTPITEDAQLTETMVEDPDATADDEHPGQLDTDDSEEGVSEESEESDAESANQTTAAEETRLTGLGKWIQILQLLLLPALLLAALVTWATLRHRARSAEDLQDAAADDTEARLAASFAPPAPAETAPAEVASGDTEGSDDDLDEFPPSPVPVPKLDQVDDYEVASAPSLLDPESLVGEEFYNVEEPVVYVPRETLQEQEIAGLKAQLTERDGVVNQLQEQISMLSQQLEAVAARLAGGASNTVLSPVSEREWHDDSFNPRDHVDHDHDPDRSAFPSRDADDRRSYPDDFGAGSDDNLRSRDFSGIEEDPASASVVSLREELADLFELHSKSALVNRTESANDDRQSSEDSHNDSVASYLNTLLERSKKEKEDESIFVDRRRSSGVFEGADRRNRPAPQPQKSYLESYLQQHGGRLEEDLAELQTKSTEKPSEPAKQLPPRSRVDVDAIRRDMASLRHVATISVEQALAAHRIREARNRLWSRMMVVICLALVAILAILTNLTHILRLSSLNWLFGALILLGCVELFLRVQSIRKQRHESRLRILEKPEQRTVVIPEPATAETV